jgi:Flp pilus assembly protein TadB
MYQCKAEIDLLKSEIEEHIWTFRALWLLSLAALVWGIVVVHYDVIIVAASTAIISLVGIARTRLGRKMADRVSRVCLIEKR